MLLLDQELQSLRNMGNESEAAADEIVRLRGEVYRLIAALKKANDQSERFERGWYLRGDELERLREFLAIWIADGSLQTFEHREKFRAAAKALLGA